MIRRREFIAGLGASAAWPVVARAHSVTVNKLLNVLALSSLTMANAPTTDTIAAPYHARSECRYWHVIRPRVRARGGTASTTHRATGPLCGRTASWLPAPAAGVDDRDQRGDTAHVSQKPRRKIDGGTDR
jgi:hypothetical protein